VKLVCDGQPKTVSAGQFVVIMILLQKIRGGMAIPPSVPSVLQELLADDADKPDKVDKVDKAKTKTKKEAKETKAPKEDDDAWKLEKSMYNKLKKLFEQQTEGEDTLAPPLAIKCFKKSGVPEETVKTVTKMVLKGHKGPVELGQFVVIMYMLKMIKEGASAPTTLPASLKKFL
jgi:singapore isolate B (sub-type 7) whole genome shotgun sequence assembly, scaffold_10